MGLDVHDSSNNICVRYLFLQILRSVWGLITRQDEPSNSKNVAAGRYDLETQMLRHNILQPNQDASNGNPETAPARCRLSRVVVRYFWTLSAVLVAGTFANSRHC